MSMTPDDDPDIGDDDWYDDDNPDTWSVCHECGCEERIWYLRQYGRCEDCRDGDIYGPRGSFES